MSNEKTPEQLRQEMIDNISKGSTEYISEVAMPGVQHQVKDVTTSK